MQLDVAEPTGVLGKCEFQVGSTQPIGADLYRNAPAGRKRFVK